MQRLFFVLPVAVLLVLLFAAGDSSPGAAVDAVDAAPASELPGRLVVVVVDSLRRETLEADGVMPGLLALSKQSDVTTLDVETCAANFTYPCLQTMFEGRQSPFVAGLHNFTGRASDARSVPADLAARGRKTAILSDISLVSLYGNSAQRVVNVEGWAISHLARDLKAIDQLEAWLKDPEIDDIFFHLVGTDKASHQSLPGSEAYAAHFRAVDVRLSEVLAGLDWSRDSLIITGDHGHDAAGHHTRQSLAILAGARFHDLFAQLDVGAHVEQPELAYLMSYARLLPMPPDYEGRYFLLENARTIDPGAVAQAFVATTRATFAQAGYPTEDLRAALDLHRQQRAGRYLRALWQNLPLLAGYFFWLLVFSTELSGRAPPAMGWRLHLAVGLSILLTWWLSAPLWWVSLGLSGAYVVASALWVRRFGGVRTLLWLVALLVVGAWISFYAKQWAEFFHTRGGYVPAQPIFYGMLPLVGVALAWLRDGDWRRAPEAAMAFGILCMPSGVYYYQTGQNFFWGFFLGAALVGLVVAARGLARGGAVRAQFVADLTAWWKPWGLRLVLAAAAVSLLLQEAGGWEWTFFPTRWLGWAPGWVSWLVYGLIAAYTCALLEHGRQRVWMVLYLVASALAAVVGGEMLLASFAASHAVLLFMATYFSLRARPAPGEVAGDVASDAALVQRARHDALVLWAGLLASCWSMTEGFFIHNVDFHFAFAYFGHFQKESMTFVAVSLVTLVKYGLPICGIALFYRMRLGAEAWQRTSAWLLFFGGLHLLTLFVQMNFTALGSSEKLYELAISEAIFVFGLLTMMAVFMALERLWRRAR